MIGASGVDCRKGFFFQLPIGKEGYSGKESALFATHFQKLVDIVNSGTFPVRPCYANHLETTAGVLIESG